MRLGGRSIAVLAVAVAGIPIAGCRPSARAIDWRFHFRSSELAMHAVAIEGRILEGGCGEGRPVRFTEEIDPSSTSSMPPLLAPGRYGFDGRARDASCVWYAVGCSDVSLPMDDEGARVVVELDAATTPVAACAADRCTDGRCEGVDAGQVDGGAPCTEGRSIASVGLGFQHSCAVAMDGTLWCWGANDATQLGLGDSAPRFLPAQIGTATTWRRVGGGERHTCGLQMDGSLWCWGGNDHGQLGLGDTADRALPVRVGTSTWDRFTINQHATCAVAADGTAWCWGQNDDGELGAGDTTMRDTPTAIGARAWTDLRLGWDHACGVAQDGTLWCWGVNANGELGLGSMGASVLTQTQIGSDSDWGFVGPGEQHTCALKTGGALFCWGHNGDGQLAAGDLLVRSAPTASSSPGPWRAIASGEDSSCALVGDGSLACWGENDFGQAGGGAIDPPRVQLPQVVTSDMSWSDFATSFDHVCGVRADGSLRCWGDNASGQLGVGDTTMRASPAPVCVPLP